MAKKLFKNRTMLVAVIAVLVIAFLIFFQTSSDQTAKFYSAVSQTRSAASGQLQTAGVVAKDSDNDGLSDAFETKILRTNPNSWDTDGDGIYDSRELAWGTNPLDSNSRIYCCSDGSSKNTLIDSDTDGISDVYESILGTNSNSADSDGDGYCDSYEIQQGYDPTSAANNPGNGNFACVWFR